MIAKCLLEYLKGRDCVGDIDVDMGVILILICNIL
jgi:hypothetical protein